MVKLEIDLHNYPEDGSIFKRTAVRGIIEREGKVLLIAGKYGDLKFPGGGAKPGETLEDTLQREVREETGYALKEGSARKWGLVTERRKGEQDDIMEMESHYFFCQVEGPEGEQSLDDYEEEYGYRPVWVTLSEAIQKNRLAEQQDTGPIPWVTRDRKVMERLQKEAGPC